MSKTMKDAIESAAVQTPASVPATEVPATDNLTETEQLRELGAKQENQIQALQADIEAMRSRCIENILTEAQRVALVGKYQQKFGKLMGERESHKRQWPQYADNTAALWVIAQATTEANERIAAANRELRISDVLTCISSYTLRETLSTLQVEQNKDTDRKLVNIRDTAELVENHLEAVKILKAVRLTWLKSFDTGHKQEMDKKITRAARILGVSPSELE